MKQQPVEWLLDRMERDLQGVSFASPTFSADVKNHLAAWAHYFPWLILIFWRRPSVLKKRQALWDTAKDYSAGIEAGAFPKPSWWDTYKERALCRESGQ